MALSSSSTLTDIEAQRDDNAGWFVDASVVKAGLYAEALTMWLGRVPQSASDPTYNYEHDIKVHSELLKRVERWLGSRRAGGSGVKHVDLRNFRQ